MCISAHHLIFSSYLRPIIQCWRNSLGRKMILIWVYYALICSTRRTSSFYFVASNLSAGNVLFSVITGLLPISVEPCWEVKRWDVYNMTEWQMSGVEGWGLWKPHDYYYYYIWSPACEWQQQSVTWESEGWVTWVCCSWSHIDWTVVQTNSTHLILLCRWQDAH